MNTQSFSVSIVLPNWNGKHLLKKNLPSILAAAPGVEVIVADDASIDGSVEFLKETYSTILVVENKRQKGFAGNVNSAVLRATGDIVMLLNTDVRPEAGFLKPVLRHFSDPTVAAVGCLEKSHEPEGVVLRGRGVARWEKGYFIHARGEVDKSDTAWVVGGSSAFRLSVWKKLGGMDTLYNPFYWEDIDLSYRILKAGYRIVFENKSVVNHFHEEGKIKTSYSPEDIKRIVYRNQFIFLWKNISDWNIWFAHIGWTPVRLVQALFIGEGLMLQGYVLALVKLPAILISRARFFKYRRRKDADVFTT